MVNIILAAYNGVKYMKEQIDSILRNTYSAWRLWIFDDGSTDNTSSLVEEYIQQYPDKILYHKNDKNKGFVLNFLEGIQFVAEYYDTELHQDSRNMSNKADDIAKYYMFCDQDDVWKTDKIEMTLKQMKKTEKKSGQDSAIAVFTDAVVVDENLKELHASFFKAGKLNTKKLDLPHILMENKLIGCSVMINEGLQKKMKVIPKNARYHDWWISLIASTFGYISYLPQATLLYRQHSNNIVGNQNFLSYIKNRISSFHLQKEVLNKTMKQAEEFYDIYHIDMTEIKNKLIYNFAHLKEYNWIMRRVLILKCGYLKTGIIRNLGLLLLI